jgi:hypothetical protein
MVWSYRAVRGGSLQTKDARLNISTKLLVVGDRRYRKADFKRRLDFRGCTLGNSLTRA